MLDGLVQAKTALVSLYWSDARWAGTSIDWIGLLVLVRCEMGWYKYRMDWSPCTVPMLDGLVQLKTALVSLYWSDARWAGTSKDWIGLLVLVQC